MANDIKNIVFGSAKASVYDFSRRRKQKCVMSFTIGTVCYGSSFETMICKFCLYLLSELAFFQSKIKGNPRSILRLVLYT